MDLIDTIQTELLKSPELTGIWERKLRQIEKGEYAIETFKQELIQMVIDLTVEVKTATYRAITVAAEQPAKKEKEKEKEPTPKKDTPPKEPKKAILLEEQQCPKCKSHLLKKGNTAYGCANFKVCGFKVPFEAFGKKLSDKQLLDLLTKGKTGKTKGWKLTSADNETEGKLKLNAAFELEIEQ
jgi:DNA topoisomerase-3